MEAINKKELAGLLAGEVEDSTEIIAEYSRDTSLFMRTPDLVVFPKDADDIKKLVSWVSEKKASQPKLSITARSAGSDMTGGPLNDSIILGTTRYLNHEDVDEDNLTAVVEPGVYYRDFEKETLPEHITFPSYPASKRLAAMGGIIMNNSGGEKTLRYGQTRDFVDEVSMVLADGNLYDFGPLSKAQLEEKKAQDNHEGELYRKLFDLFEGNYEAIKAAEPKVSKNSAGYALWRVWDRDKGIFDLSQLFVGSQGTLGVLAKAKIRLMKDKPHRRMLATFYKSWDDLPDVVNAVLPHGPESLETFDRATLKLGLRFMPQVAKRAGQSFVSFALRFLPEVFLGMRMLGMPKLIVLIELAEDSEAELDKKTKQIQKVLKPFRVWYRVLKKEEEMAKYLTMRHESFALLREHVKGKKTAPFVEDFAVQPERMPEFLPKMLAVLKEYGIKANIAGHAGNGNYHIIPLMDLNDEKERAKILPAADKIYQLIIEHGGTITAEHNDGIMRTPYLEDMYGEEIYGLFERVKNILDPQNIFNPGKKIGGTRADITKYLAPIEEDK